MSKGNGRNLPTVISALTARTQFGQIPRRAGERRERFLVDKRGEPQVVIMGIEDFLETVAPQSAVLAAIRAEAKRNRKSPISMREIDREVAASRRERTSRHATTKSRA